MSKFYKIYLIDLFTRCLQYPFAHISSSFFLNFQKHFCFSQNFNRKIIENVTIMQIKSIIISFLNEMKKKHILM